MRAVGLIPARYRASRFPGKPLALIAGMSMIQRVWRGARGAKSLERVIVATDDARIADACRGFGAEVALTRADHASGTDRIAEVAAGLDCDVVVNVQGDEPLIEGFAIDAVVAALADDPEVPIATLVHAAEPDALADPNRVKVVLDRRGRALYFSRSAIPYARDGGPRRAAGSTSASTPIAATSCCASRRSRRRPPSAPRGSSSCARSSTAFAIRCAVIEGWTSAAVDVPADVAVVEARLARALREPSRVRGERRAARRAHGAGVGPALFELAPLRPRRRARHAELHHARPRARGREPVRSGLVVSCALPFGARDGDARRIDRAAPAGSRSRASRATAASTTIATPPSCPPRGARAAAIDRFADGVVGARRAARPRALRRPAVARRRHADPARRPRRVRGGARRHDRHGRHPARAHGPPLALLRGGLAGLCGRSRARPLAALRALALRAPGRRGRLRHRVRRGAARRDARLRAAAAPDRGARHGPALRQHLPPRPRSPRPAPHDGRYAFLFAAPPLPAARAFDAPINPLAIK